MAHSLSAKKRIRQNAKHRAVNRSRKKQVKLETRKFSEALAGGDSQKASEVLRLTLQKIDKVAAKGTIHKNTAARKKSRLQRQLNAMAPKG